MGKWTVKAWGEGLHHNAHSPTSDADEQAKRFCEILRTSGQVLGGCEFTYEVDGKQMVEVIARPPAPPVVPPVAVVHAPPVHHETTHVDRATVEAADEAHVFNDPPRHAPNKR